MLNIEFGACEIVFSSDETSYAVPVGVETLATMISGDPPHPEDLINAIGLVMDHVEDVLREVPAAAGADRIECSGIGLGTVAAVEVGKPPTFPFALTREAAEEVFRTLATESAADRARNPGLPAAEVHQVLGVCCALVAVLRALHAPMVILSK